MIKSNTKSLNKHNNSFDFVRFILATMVIFSHSYPLLLGKNHPGDLMVRFSENQISFGTIAVSGFFVVSGFLVTQSILRTRNYLVFIMKRLLRIVPALFVALFSVSFILGPFLTKLDLHTYFFYDGVKTSPLRYLFENITFNYYGYHPVQDLFKENPFTQNPNGSIWTLKFELFMYLLLPALALLRFLRFKILLLLLTLFFILLTILHYQFDIQLFKVNFWVIRDYANFVKLAAQFMAGAMLYLYFGQLKFNPRVLAALFIAIMAAIYAGWAVPALVTLFPFFIIGLATRKELAFFGKYGDFSYGLYIYAFPIQQTVVYFLKGYLNPISYFFLCFILILAVAVISWKFVEKPFLSLKTLLEKPSATHKSGSASPAA